MLGVLSKQMEDFNQFPKDWYIDDAVRAQTGAVHRLELSASRIGLNGNRPL
jgi:hypothetical protein